MSNVTRLVDRAPVAVSDHADMGDWLKGWAEAFAAGEYGEFRSIAVVLESEDGQVATISQSLGAMDGIRVAGLLMAAAHRKLDGNGQIQDLANER